MCAKSSDHRLRMALILVTGLAFWSVCGALDSSADNATPGNLPRPTVRIEAEPQRIGRGCSVTLDVAATLPDGKPAAGCSHPMPTANGGAHQYADGHGHTRFLLPLLQPGIVELQVEIPPPPRKPVVAPNTTDSQLTFNDLGQWPETDRKRLLRPASVEVEFIRRQTSRGERTVQPAAGPGATKESSPPRRLQALPGPTAPRDRDGHVLRK